jgi:hypothetical protein
VVDVPRCIAASRTVEEHIVRDLENEFAKPVQRETIPTNRLIAIDDFAFVLTQH